MFSIVLIKNLKVTITYFIVQIKIIKYICQIEIDESYKKLLIVRK